MILRTACPCAECGSPELFQSPGLLFAAGVAYYFLSVRDMVSRICVSAMMFFIL